MSKLSREKVIKVANLAKLATNEDDIPTYVESLSNILQFVEQMNSVVTDDITPMAHPLNIPQPLREDKITEQNQRDCLQPIAPQLNNGQPAVKFGFYLVPKVIE